MMDTQICATKLSVSNADILSPPFIRGWSTAHYTIVVTINMLAYSLVNKQ